MEKQSAKGPEVFVEQVRQAHRDDRGQWRIVWRVGNRNPSLLQLTAARLPHGKFRGPEKVFAPALELAAGQSTEIELSVVCNEAAGTIIENAFVIMRATREQAHWRIFVRLRVTVDESGVPQAVTESITTQREGFSIHGGA